MARNFHSIAYQYNSLFKQGLKSTNRICNRSVVLSYKVLGESLHSDEPPVFLFHGLLGNKKEWEGLGKIILNVTRRSVVAVDLRNHGDSPHVNSHRYEDHAADILRLFEKLGVQQASLIGHSMGGKAAMCLALVAPLKISGILVVDASPVPTSKHYLHNFPKVLAAMKELDFKNLKTINHAQSEAKSHLNALISDNQILKNILANIKLKNDNTIGWMVNLDVLLKDINFIAGFPMLTLKEKKYFGPTLLLGGQLSDFIPPDDLTEIRTFFPKAVIIYIRKTRHVHIDDPKSFLEIAISFIRTHHYKREFKPPALS